MERLRASPRYPVKCFSVNLISWSLVDKVLRSDNRRKLLLSGKVRVKMNLDSSLCGKSAILMDGEEEGSADGILLVGFDVFRIVGEEVGGAFRSGEG